MLAWNYRLELAEELQEAEKNRWNAPPKFCDQSRERFFCFITQRIEVEIFVDQTQSQRITTTLAQENKQVGTVRQDTGSQSPPVSAQEKSVNNSLDLEVTGNSRAQFFPDFRKSTRHSKDQRANALRRKLEKPLRALLEFSPWKPQKAKNFSKK